MSRFGWEARTPLRAPLHALGSVREEMGCAALRSVNPGVPPPAPPLGSGGGTAAVLQRHLTWPSSTLFEL